jgi:flagellar basal-body rod protein FlgG
MMQSLSIGATGMLSQQLNVDVISNNISNMTTTGFKRRRAEFQDLLYRNLRRPGATSSSIGTIVPSGIQIGAGVKTASVNRLHEQGSMEVTNNNLDLAINGRGFFQIQRPDGETAYTRAGSFQLNPDGDIVTGDGYLVEPNITVPEDAIDISVNENGEVFVKLDGQIEPQNVGQLQLVSFANPAGLEAIGQNLLLETPASGDPTTGNPGDDGFGRIEQGTLELSNVDIVSEITRMITAQRAYEMNSKVIQTSDEMLGEIARMS